MLDSVKSNAFRIGKRVKSLFSKAYPRERELDLLPILVDRIKTAVDVGANIGRYTEALLSLTPDVISIEPNPRFARRLKAQFPRSKVIPVAVSDSPGRQTLRIPVDPFYSGMATIENTNQLMQLEVDSVEVEVATLDSLNLANVGFFKIDVEGHESAVIRGAARCISEHRPTLLIEAEDRYRPGTIAAIFDQMVALSYSGYMLLEGCLRPISEFDPSIHQAVGSTAESYKTGHLNHVFNFIFLPS